MRSAAGLVAPPSSMTSNSDLGQVARRRIGALAAMMSAVECRDAAAVMTDTKIAVPSSGMGPDKGLALGGGTAGIWKTKVHVADSLPAGVDYDLAEVGLSPSGARPGTKFRGGWVDYVDSAAIVTLLVAANVVCNRSRGTAFKVAKRTMGSNPVRAPT